MEEGERERQTNNLTPLRTILEYFLLTEHRHPRLTIVRNRSGTLDSYTPSMSGAES